MFDTKFITNKNAMQLAYIYQKPHRSKDSMPEIIFFSGFRSDMRGTKAQMLTEFTAHEGLGFLKFDYSGHGESQGDFKELTLSDWIMDAKTIISHIFTDKDKPLIFIGSSMGGWIALILLCDMGFKNTAFIGLAPAPDFTVDLMDECYVPQNKRLLELQGFISTPCAYDEDDYIITQKFLEDSLKHLLLRNEIAYDGIVHLLQGMCDADVPWQRCLTLAEKITSPTLTVHLIKDGDHRLSRPQDMVRLRECVKEIISQMNEA